MPATGPGDPPAVVVKRARRVKRQAKQAQRVRQQTAQAQPLSSKPGRPVSVKRVASAQRATQKAAPLDEVAKHAPVVVPVAAPKRVKAKPLSQKPPKTPMGAGKPVVTKRQQRAIAVAAYDQLPSGAAKRAHVKAAQGRIEAGKATEADKAIVHAHKTRVEGRRKVAQAVRDFEALGSTTVDNPSGLHLKPGFRIKDGHMLDASGRRVGKVETFKHPIGQTVANLPSVGKVVATLGPAATAGLKAAHVPKVIANIPKDAGELAITSPSSVTKFVSTAVKHPGKALHQAEQPYKDLAKHPGKFISEHPVTTALMVAPAARLPGRAVGRATRLAGKQTLARPTATLANTAVKEARTGSRGVVTRAVQSARDKSRPAPSVTAYQVDRRVDLAFAKAEKHADRVRNRIVAESRKNEKKLPVKLTKGQRQQFREAARTRAQGAADNQKQVDFAREFGATARHHDGRVVEQPHATEGVLHPTKADAEAVAAHLNAKGQTIPKGHGTVLTGDPVGRLYAKKPVDVKYVVQKVGQDAGDKHVVIPEQIAKRLEHHGKVESSKSRDAKILRQTRGMFTRAVLPYTPTWLSGQAIEGGVRMGVAGAGPMSLARMVRLKQRHPEEFKKLADGVLPGGAGARAMFENSRKTLHEEFPESNIARLATDVGKTPGIKHVRALHHALSGVVFNTVNGKMLEGIPQAAIVGRALKDSPLMERSTIGLSNKAIDDLANGLKETHNQVEAVRALHRDYGKYSAFSPHMREQIMHWTPFIPWYLNTAQFLLKTLPRDHPLAAALIADIGAAEEDWRKKQGLSLRYPEKQLPPWMLGGYPIHGGKDIVRIGHYTPSGIGTELTGQAFGLFLPQFQGIAKASFGFDWKNDPLKHPDGRPYSQTEMFKYGLLQLAEALVPLAGKAQQVATAEDKGAAAKKLLRPVSTVHRKDLPDSGATSVTPVKVRPVKVKPVVVKPVGAG